MELSIGHLDLDIQRLKIAWFLLERGVIRSRGDIFEKD